MNPKVPMALTIIIVAFMTAGREKERAHRLAPSSYPKGSCAEQIAQCFARGAYAHTTMADPPELVCDDPPVRVLLH